LHNALDRHVAAGNGERTAIIFEPDSPEGETRTISYAALLADVIRFANTLKKMGVSEGRPRHHLYADDPRGRGGDACLRAHRRGAQRRLRRFLAEAIHGRIEDCASDWVICADEGLRGGKPFR